MLPPFGQSLEGPAQRRARVPLSGRHEYSMARTLVYPDSRESVMPRFVAPMVPMASAVSRAGEPATCRLEGEACVDPPEPRSPGRPPDMASADVRTSRRSSRFLPVDYPDAGGSRGGRGFRFRPGTRTTPLVHRRVRRPPSRPRRANTAGSGTTSSRTFAEEITPGSPAPGCVPRARRGTGVRCPRAAVVRAEPGGLRSGSAADRTPRR